MMQRVYNLDHDRNAGGDEAHGGVAQVCGQLAGEIVVHAPRLPRFGAVSHVLLSFSSYANSAIGGSQK